MTQVKIKQIEGFETLDTSSFTQADDGKLFYYDNETGKFITDDTVTHGTVIINCKKSTAGTIQKGTPVYLVGFDNDIHTVEAADASDSNKMPVIGIAAEDLDNTNSRHVTTFGKVVGVDTSSYIIGTNLYIGVTAGEFSSTRPTGANTQIQRIAKVLKSDAISGQILVYNTARTAGLPNLGTDKLWIGDANGIPQEVDKSTIGGGISDGDKGDITVSSSGSTWTIDNSVITLAKMADVDTGTLFYRKTSGTGAPEIQTLATLKTDLGLTGTNSGDQTITLTSDVTGSGTGSFTTTISNDVVTNAKLANMPQTTIKGRANGSGTGDPIDLNASQVLEIIKTADGSGSGLDADLLDGLHASSFSLSGHTHSSSDITNLSHFATVYDSATLLTALADTNIETILIADNILISTATSLTINSNNTKLIFGNQIEFRSTGLPWDTVNITWNDTTVTDDTLIKSEIFFSTISSFIVNNSQGFNMKNVLTSDNISFVKNTGQDIKYEKGNLISGDAIQEYWDNTFIISNDAVTNSKLANMTQATIKGRANGAGTGDPQDLTALQVLDIVKTVDGTGSGLDADLLDGVQGANYLQKTSNFLSKTITIESPTATEDITIFRTDVAITVQEVIAVSTGTSPSTTYSLRHHTDRNNTGNLLTTLAATTSTTTGNTATLSDATIPADSWVWLETTAASGTNVKLTIDIRYTID